MTTTSGTALRGDTVCRVIDVMGTVVSVDVRQIAPPDAEVAAALDAVADWLRWVDRTFSTYQPDSEISRLARRELSIDDCHPHVGVVLAACAEAAAATDGYFATDIGHGLDPTGLVKGWAAQRASELLRAAGLGNHAIGAGGDVVCAGEQAPGEPWRIGIADPLDRARVCSVVTVRDAAVATSGVTERGRHVLDPHTGRPACGLLSATVVGPDLTRADAYATAVLASGCASPPWFRALDGHQLLTVTEDGRYSMIHSGLLLSGR